MVTRLMLASLVALCVRTVDGEGYLRGRTGYWHSSKSAGVLERLPYSHRGACIAGQQGPTERVTVCLVGSSRCEHDRTTGVWDDQVEWYLERYPGSYRGECTSECSTHKDDCLEKAEAFRGFEDWYGWMKDMERIRRERYGHP